MKKSFFEMYMAFAIICLFGSLSLLLRALAMLAIEGETDSLLFSLFPVLFTVLVIRGFNRANRIYLWVCKINYYRHRTC